MVQSSKIRQNDAKRLFKAALEAGFENAKITIHPDGRIEALASFAEQARAVSENSWDVVLK
ncbi:hypothetical protein [Rhizobiales bacterium]|uniref:hypothetical protein n=1 Tax=Rhizobium sp. 11_C7_N12_5 TaxID=3240770 RepID=UPI0013AF987A